MSEALESKSPGLIAQLKTIARPLWRELRKNLYTPHWVATENQGNQFLFLSKNLLMQYNIEHQFNEKEYLGKILDNIKSSDIVLDIGSYIGLHAILFAAKANRVYCVEPDPNCQKEIIRNAVKNNLADSITVIPAAAWDRNRDLELEFAEEYWRSSHLKGTVNANDNRVSPRNFRSISKVAGKTLDKIAGEIKQKIDIVKIDTEGAELHILQGGINFWLSPPRMVAIEKHPGFLAGWNQKPEEVDLFMSEHGYQKTFEVHRGNEILTIFSSV